MKREENRRKDIPGKPLSEKEMPAYLATMTANDWRPLFALIPMLEAKKGLGRWRSPKPEGGVNIMPFFSFGKTEREFLDLVYGLRLVISFDWGGWNEGRQLLRQQEMNGLELVTLLKLLTAIVRNDRFCEGALHSAFSNGRMLGILKAIRTRVEERAAPPGKRTRPSPAK